MGNKFDPEWPLNLSAQLADSIKCRGARLPVNDALLSASMTDYNSYLTPESLGNSMFVIRAVVMFVWFSVAPVVWANHGATEPSDGTVNSFIEVNPPKEVKPVPMLRDESDPIDLSVFKGKLVLLNFWATWCPPCLRELPALDRLQQRLGGEGFEVVAVALDRRGYAGAREFYDKLKIQHLGLYHGTVEAFGEEFPVDVFPASFLIDPQGRVLSFLRSYADWDAPEADKMIQHHLQSH